MANDDLSDRQIQERSLNLEFSESRTIPAQIAAAADAKTTLYVDPRTEQPGIDDSEMTTEVLSAKFILDAAYAMTTGNTVTLSLLARNPDGTTASTIASKTLSANIAAGVVTDLGIAVGASGSVPLGGSLALLAHQNASGAALPAGTITLGLAWPTQE